MGGSKMINLSLEDLKKLGDMVHDQIIGLKNEQRYLFQDDQEIVQEDIDKLYELLNKLMDGIDDIEGYTI